MLERIIKWGYLMNYKEFAKTLFDSEDQMFPKGTDAQTCLNILAEHFLGKGLVLNYPGHITQWNSEVTHEILREYPSGKIRRIHK